MSTHSQPAPRSRGDRAGRGRGDRGCTAWRLLRGALGPVACSSLVLGLVLAPALSQPVAAQDATDREIIESQRRLEQIQRERDQLRQETTRLRSTVTDLSGAVANVESQVDVSSDLIEELDLQAQQRERQIERNTYELLMARDRLAERRAILHRRLRDIHRRGPLQTVEVLLAAESFADLLNRYKYLYLIARHDRRLADEVGTLERELVGRERALRSNLNDLDFVRRVRAEEHGQLSTLQDQQREALSSAEVRERMAAVRIRELERDEARLTDLVAAVEARRRTLPAPAAPSITGRSLGVLDWPLEGQIVYRFGPDRGPSGTTLHRQGVGIAAPAGAVVRAVAGGTVVLAGPFEGYGPAIVLSHGAGYYTLYLYLRDLRVREGDRVERAQALAAVGGETTSEGPHLEFQLRLPGGQAVDPLAWLRSR